MFKSLFSLILTAGKNISKNFFGRVMMGAGFGLVTISGLNTFVDYYKAKTLQQFGNLGAFSGLLGLAGIDKAVSIIIGAYIASVYIKTFGASIRAIKK